MAKKKRTDKQQASILRANKIHSQMVELGKKAYYKKHKK